MIVALAFAALAQAPADPALAWNGTLRYGFEAFTGSRSAWHVAAVSVGRRFSAASLQLEQAVVSRFGTSDAATSLDGYYAFAGGYANLRVQRSPGAEVLPESDLAVELFRDLGGGFEGSAAVRRMWFRGATVTIAGAGLARYSGPWYVRGRLTVAPSGNGTTAGGSVTVRRYFATVDDRLEISAGAGTELVAVGAGQFDRRRTGAASVRWRLLAGRSWGFEAASTWGADQGAPSRAGLSGSLFARW